MTAPDSYDGLLDRLIAEGIAAACRDYTDPEDAEKLAGSIEGFEACRGKKVTELRRLLDEAQTGAQMLGRRDPPVYWRMRCRAAEIEWVCNCVSVLLQAAGLPVIVPPTYRAFIQVAKIVGVRGNHQDPSELDS